MVREVPDVKWSRRVLQALGERIGRSPRDIRRAAPWAPKRWQRSRRAWAEARRAQAEARTLWSPAGRPRSRRDRGRARDADARPRGREPARVEPGRGSPTHGAPAPDPQASTDARPAPDWPEADDPEDVLRRFVIHSDEGDIPVELAFDPTPLATPEGSEADLRGHRS